MVPAGKRPKKKWSHIPPGTWLPGVLEFLDLTEEKLTSIDFMFDSYDARKAWNPESRSPEELQEVVVNMASRTVLSVVKDLRLRVLRQLYREVCKSHKGTWHKTWMIKHLCYKISQGLGLMNARMVANYDKLCGLTPDKVPDIYGHSGHIGKGVSAKKPHKKRERKGTTISGIIVECLHRKGGATRKEILNALIQQFPGRSPNAMRNTISVQLSSHLKKRFGDALVRKGDNYTLSRGVTDNG